MKSNLDDLAASLSAELIKCVEAVGEIIDNRQYQMSRDIFNHSSSQ